MYLKQGNLVNILVGTFGAFFVFLMTLWYRFGRDPETPTVIPQFTVPYDLSPASMAYLNDGKYSNKLVTASIVNLATNGFLKIKEYSSTYLWGLGKSSSYTLEKLRNAAGGMYPEEKKILDEIDKKLVVDGKYDPLISSMMIYFKSEVLKQNKAKVSQGNNRNKMILPFVFLVAIYWFLIISAYVNTYNSDMLALGIGIFVASLAIYIPLLAIPNLRFRSKWLWLLSVILPVLVLVLGNNFYTFEWIFLFYTVSLFVFTVFKFLLEQPTEEILKIKSAINGFKMYLSAAENQLLQFYNPPSITPEIFEKMLPYAIALGVDKIWGEKFNKYIEDSQLSYDNQWYIGSTSGLSRGISHSFASSFGSAISGSSTQPSSSGSGSGGGGSSGGGGGGGGGGGW